MPSTIIEITDWARPHVGRRVHHIKQRMRIDTALRQRGLVVGRVRRMQRTKPFVVTPNGKDFLLAAEWNRCLREGEVLVVITAPPAGGGGGSRVLAVLAIVALSVFTAGAAAAAYGAGVAGATGLSTAAAGALVSGVVGTAVSVAGNMLLNAILPPPKAPSGQNRGDTSPNYGINAEGNTARLLEAIPVLYGRFRINLDFAAVPYTDYRSNDQYLYQLFMITQGQLQIESIRIGETDVSAFSDVQYEVIPPGGTVSLFPDNVVSSDAVAGISLEKPSDGGTWSGPFITNPPETHTTRIGIDVAWPGGLYRYNSDGNKRTANSPWTAQAQMIDNDGNTIGGWTTLITDNKWSDSEKPIFESQNFDVAPGRYQVRLMQTEPVASDGQVVNQMTWQGLKAYLPSESTYGDCTMIAMVVKAGAQVNAQTSRQVNVIGTRMLPVWDGGTWSAPQPTRNPAWAIADAFRNATYGRGWPDNRINLQGLLALAQTWDQRGDFYDGVFDTKVTLWDGVTQIARVGRAIPMYFAGVVDIIRDAPRSVPTLMLAPHNIVQGSLKIDYSYPTYDTPDYVVVEYTNTNTWQPQTVDCALTGSAKLVPKNVQLTGATSRDQAFREGMYMAAANRDQRKFVTVTVEMEGYIPRYGDLIDISHDVPQWGLSGTIIKFDAPSGALLTSEPLAWYAGQTHFVALRARDGSAQGPFQVVQGVDLYHMVLQGLTAEQKAAIYVSDGTHEEPTIFQFGPGSQQSQSCLLLRATPQGNDQVELYMVNYAPSVYLAETNAAVPPPGSPSLLTPASGAPTVGSIGVTQNSGTPTVHLYVQPVPGAVGYEFQVSYDGGVTWVDVGLSPYNYIDVVLPPGTWIVRARAITASGTGGWNQNPVTVDGKPWPLGALTALTATGAVMGIRLAWGFPTGFGTLDAGATEIHYGTTTDLASAQFLTQLGYPTNTYSLQGLLAGETYYFWARLVSKSANDPGPWFGPTQGQSSTDATAILGYLTGEVNESLLGKDLAAKIGEIDTQAETIISQAQAQESLDNDNRSTKDALNGLNQTTITIQAQIGQLTTTKADITQAESIAEQTLTAQMGDFTAQEQTQAVTYVDANGNGHAFNLTKVGVTKDGQYKAAGLGIGVETQADGTLLAQVLLEGNRVAILDSASGNMQAAFVVQNGQTFIGQAFIGYGWITNAMIGSVIQSNNYNGIVGWRITKDGTAYFGGDVTIRGNVNAGSITGQFQASASVSWSGSIDSFDGGATGTFACPPPVRAGETHRPEITCEISVARQGGSDAASATVYLERQDGTAWTQLASRTYGLGQFNNAGMAFIFLDASTTTAETYRFRIGNGQTDHIQLLGVHGRVLGQRTT